MKDDGRFTTLIRASDLAGQLGDPQWAIVDCRFDLNTPASGVIDYRSAHIPGAVYVHLDDDLSSAEPVTDNGRHPLPSPAALTRLFGRLGIDNHTQVVVYDGGNGAYASRLWWMLRYMGHEAVAVLDGGWPVWEASGYPLKSGAEQRPPQVFTGAPRGDRLVTLEEIPEIGLLIDARGLERYRGEIEPLDPVAGHIPGAVNWPFGNNWTEDNRWQTAESLQTTYLDLLGHTAPEETVFYCGSGVTACVNVLAMVHAGLPEGRLYVGSWSEWSSDPKRLVATGDRPGG